MSVVIEISVHKCIECLQELDGWSHAKVYLWTTKDLDESVHLPGLIRDAAVCFLVPDQIVSEDIVVTQ